MNQRGGRLPRGGGLQNNDVIHRTAALTRWPAFREYFSNEARTPFREYFR